MTNDVFFYYRENLKIICFYSIFVAVIISPYFSTARNLRFLYQENTSRSLNMIKHQIISNLWIGQKSSQFISIIESQWKVHYEMKTLSIEFSIMDQKLQRDLSGPDRNWRIFTMRCFSETSCSRHASMLTLLSSHPKLRHLPPDCIKLEVVFLTYIRVQRA